MGQVKGLHVAQALLDDVGASASEEPWGPKFRQISKSSVFSKYG